MVRRSWLTLSSSRVGQTLDLGYLSSGRVVRSVTTAAEPDNVILAKSDKGTGPGVKGELGKASEDQHSLSF